MYMFEFIRNHAKLGIKIIFIIFRCAHSITKDLNNTLFSWKDLLVFTTWTSWYGRNSLCSSIADQMRKGKLFFSVLCFMWIKMTKGFETDPKVATAGWRFACNKSSCCCHLCIPVTHTTGRGKELDCALVHQHLQVLMLSLWPHCLGCISDWRPKRTF